MIAQTNVNLTRLLWYSKQVIGYFRREIFSICFIALGIGPTVLDLSVDFQPRILWIVSCIFMSFFTLLPADYGTDIQLVYVTCLVYHYIEVYSAYSFSLYFMVLSDALVVYYWPQSTFGSCCIAIENTIRLS